MGRLSDSFESRQKISLSGNWNNLLTSCRRSANSWVIYVFRSPVRSSSNGRICSGRSLPNRSSRKVETANNSLCTTVIKSTCNNVPNSLLVATLRRKCANMTKERFARKLLHNSSGSCSK